MEVKTNTAAQLKQQLGLLPHPEGGHYIRKFESIEKIPTSRGMRAASSAISYLLEGDDFSAFHRIQSDETWAYHQGTSGISVLELSDAGIKEHRLDQITPLVTIAKNTWFAAKLTTPKPQAFALCSCIVAPGFDFKDFELADQTQLIHDYPKYADTIKVLTRDLPVQPLPLQHHTIVILTAMDLEADVLAAKLGMIPVNIPAFTRWGARCFHQDLPDRQVFLIANPGDRQHVNNIGTIAATQAATLALEYLQPQTVISAGVAGAYTDQGIAIGDVIYGTEAMLHGHSIPLDALSAFGQGIYPCARIETFIQHSNVKLGSISSGNHFLNEQERNKLPSARQASVEDMEAGAIAQILAQHAVDFICLKAITNLTGVLTEQEQAESDKFDNNLKQALDALGEKLLILRDMI